MEIFFDENRDIWKEVEIETENKKVEILKLFLEVFEGLNEERKGVEASSDGILVQ